MTFEEKSGKMYVKFKFGSIDVKKYIIYFCLQILSVASLIGFFAVGNYLFELYPTGETNDALNAAQEIYYVYVDPYTGVLGVFVQALGYFLFCLCFGIMAKYCKTDLSIRAKHVSFTLFGIFYILAGTFLFTNNFAMMNFGDSFAIKEIWANALNFFVCVSASILGFCVMYHFKNKDNHLLY